MKQSSSIIRNSSEVDEDSSVLRNSSEVDEDETAASVLRNSSEVDEDETAAWYEESIVEEVDEGYILRTFFSHSLK
jgi:hypothetical protein